MAKGVIGVAEVKQYHEQGFVLVKGMFDAQEIGLLHRAAKEDKALDDHGYGKADGEGGVVRLALWNHPGENIYGMFARCESMVPRSCGTAAGRRGVPLPFEDDHERTAQVGGAWTWHQDYGYWYQNGVLFPLLTQRLYCRGSGHKGERVPAGDRQVS